VLEMLETLVRQWKVVRDAPIPFLLCLAAVGAVQWVVLKYFYRKDEPAKNQSQAVVKDSANATGGSASSKIEFHHHYPPTPVPTAVPLPAAKPLSEAQLRRLAVLKTGKVEGCNISIDHFNHSWQIGTKEWTNLSGVGYLLPVTYDALESETTFGLVDVAAHAHFKSDTGETIHAHSLRWIGESVRGRCSFKCGETKRLIIGFKEKRDVEVPEEDEKATKIPMGEYEVTVTMIWAVNKKAVLPEFKLSIR
jgi:hypothetical protein